MSSLLLSGDGVNTSNEDGSSGDDDITTTTAPFWVWLGLITIAMISFWLQATVTEERFIPALNTICNHYHISHDVAGATLMAAGASSPELFSSIVSLFITHSSLGLGTIVGSEIFNQLMICCGSVYAARHYRLTLDRAVIIRDVGFYAISLGLLYMALSSDRRPSNDENDDRSSGSIIVIHFTDACLLFGTYVLYVLVCGNFEMIREIFRRSSKKKSSKVDVNEVEQGGEEERMPLVPGITGMSKKNITLIDVPHNIPFVRQVRHEPKENFQDPTPPSLSSNMFHDDAENDDDKNNNTHNSNDHYQSLASGHSTSSSLPSSSSQHHPHFTKITPPATQSSRISSSTSTQRSIATTPPPQSRPSSNEMAPRETTIRSRYSFRDEFVASLRDIGWTLTFGVFSVRKEKPTDVYDLYTVEVNEYDEQLSCFLWQHSKFYNRTRISQHAWRLRWFSFLYDAYYSIPNRAATSENEEEQHLRTYRKFYRMDVDDEHLILRLKCGMEGGDEDDGRDYVFMAPSRRILEHVVSKCETLMTVWKTTTNETTTPLVFHPAHARMAADDDNDDDEPSLIESPTNTSRFQHCLHILLYPLKFLLYISIPNVRHTSTTTSILPALTATISCLLWLIIGSYAMVTSLETLASFLHIPDAVIGVTISAVGTSLPNYVGSQCAARQGLGNMAVGNAFGSNTFNILVGLGLPWMVYIAVKRKAYDELRDEDGSLSLSVGILGGVLMLFVVMVGMSDFVLYRWHANLFAVVYVGYLIFAVGRVYV